MLYFELVGLLLIANFLFQAKTNICIFKRVFSHYGLLIGNFDKLNCCFTISLTQLTLKKAIVNIILYKLFGLRLVFNLFSRFVHLENSLTKSILSST